MVYTNDYDLAGRSLERRSRNRIHLEQKPQQQQQQTESCSSKSQSNKNRKEATKSLEYCFLPHLSLSPSSSSSPRYFTLISSFFLHLFFVHLFLLFVFFVFCSVNFFYCLIFSTYYLRFIIHNNVVVKKKKKIKIKKTE